MKIVVVASLQLVKALVADFPPFFLRRSFQQNVIGLAK